MNTIGFIGAGNMATAIIKGISASPLKSGVRLSVTDISADKAAALGEYGAQALADANAVVRAAKYIVLAVKPQVIDTVLEAIADAVTADTVLVSIAAGITGEHIREKTIPDAKVVLVMPNTPLLLGVGASALSKLPGVTDEEFAFVCGIFGACGETAVITPDKMKEIIAINGSSPAFIYLFAKGFIEYGVSQGLDETVVKDLFCQSLIGSAEMMKRSGYTVDELIKMVSSPGGTTLKGLDAFYAAGLTDTVKQACADCTKRAYELSL